MPSVRDVNAGDIADREHVTVNTGQPLSKVRRRMEEHDLRTIPVVDGKRFEGMVGYREIIEKLRGDPSSAKVDSLVHTPPTVEEGDNAVELAVTRIDSGRKKFALLDDRKLAGAIGEREIVYNVADTDELKGLRVTSVFTPDVVTVRRDEGIETARTLLMDNNISRLPVVDGDGEIVGLLSSHDVLRAMVPRDQMQRGDYKGHKDSLSDIPVHELMQSIEEIGDQILEDGDLTVPDAIDRMKRHHRRELIAVEDGEPVGILTLKDVISYIAGLEPVEGIYVQLTGPDVPEEKRVVLDKVETALQGGLGRVIDRPRSLNVHIKKYEQDGTKHKYSLNFLLVSKLGTTTVKTHEWDLLNAVDEGLDKLEARVKKQKEKRVDEKRRKQREGKYASE